MANPVQKAIYEKAVKDIGKLLFLPVIVKYFKAPIVDEVNLSDYSGTKGKLTIIWWTRVSVSINDAEGQGVESRDAVEMSAQRGWMLALYCHSSVPTGLDLCIEVMR